MKPVRVAISLSIIIYYQTIISADIIDQGITKSRSKRIVGGLPVPIESFPFIVSLRASDSYNFKHVCGGSILNPLIVLTAAHCFDKYPVNTTRVQVGSDQVLPSNPCRFDVVDAILHENYGDNSTQGDDRLKNDIALIRLKSPITCVSSVGNLTLPSPVTLFERNKTVPDGSVAKVVGWGAIADLGDREFIPKTVMIQLDNGTWVARTLLPERLMGAEVQIVSNERCSQIYGGEEFGEDRMCAYYPGRDSCTGDSGGPLMIGEAQAGVVSTGEVCAEIGSPGIYTSVAYFRDWIDRNVDILLARAAV